MLSFREQIEQLSLEQKIHLLSGDTIVQEGDAPALPRLGVAELWDSNRTERGKLFPSPASLANSFDADLFASVGEILAARGEASGNNLFVLPDSVAPIDTYDAGLSEDPLVNAHLLRGCAAGVAKRGNGFALRVPERPTAPLEDPVDRSVYYDRVYRPFLDIMEHAHCRAVFSKNGDDVDELIQKLPHRREVSVLCPEMQDDRAVHALLEGNILLSATPSVIETALENYNRIHRSIEEGGSTADELHAAMKEGSAINEEKLTSVLERRMNLAASCTSRTGGNAMVSQADEEVALLAARSSTVLLKNTDARLPLSRGTKIALIGDIINDGPESEFIGFRRSFESCLKRVSVAGYAKGYQLDSDRSDLIDEAVELARHADVAVVFLGMGSRREALIPSMKYLELPANQMALIDELSQTRTPIIAVIAGTRLPAMEFDRHVAAGLLIPPQGVMVPKALAEILEGRSNPTGRLAFAGGDNPDVDYMESQMYIHRGEKKVGPFVGYRATVSEGTVVKYPFGYGLSYNTIEHKNISFDGQQVKVRIHNKGRLPMTETLQIYMSKPTTSLLRPKEELKGFTRVELRPGESRTVYVPLEWLEVWRPKTNELMREIGNYHLYTSTCAGRRTQKMKVFLSGQQIPKGTFNLSDYLSNVSNITSKQYTMEGFCKPMKTRAALKCLGAFFILLMLFADVFYITGAVLGFYSLFPSIIWAIAGSVILFIASLIFFISYIALHTHDVAHQEKIEKKSTAALFRRAEVAEVESLEDLFVEVFDIPEQMQIQAKQTVYTEEDEGRHVHVQLDIDMLTLSDNMERFLAERGLASTTGVVRGLLASVMTSRLLVFRSPRVGVASGVVRLLSEFFGTSTYTESFATRTPADGTILYSKGYSDGLAETNVMRAIHAAKDDPEHAYFIELDQMSLAEAGTWLTPYIRYFGNPKGGFKAKENGDKIPFPANLWFVINTRIGDSIKNLEAFIANYALVIDLQSEMGSATGAQNRYRSATCQEMETLIYRSRKATMVEEELWKNVDRLESYVNDRAPYHIGNKLFLQLECYLSVYAACGGDMHDAMDSVVASKLLPAIIGRLKDVEMQDEMELVHAMEDMFGDDHVAASRYMLKNMEMQLETETTTMFAGSAVSDAVADEVTAEEDVTEAPAEIEEDETPVEENTEFEVVETVEIPATARDDEDVEAEPTLTVVTEDITIDETSEDDAAVTPDAEVADEVPTEETEQDTAEAVETEAEETAEDAVSENETTEVAETSDEVSEDVE